MIIDYKCRVFISLLCLLIFTAFIGHKISSTKTPAKTASLKYNVLFIMVDDLRPDLGCYGNRIIRSPNIDQLASNSTVFLNQFVAVPTCGASRACLLTGRLPVTTNDLSNDVLQIRQEKDIKTRPESFVQNFRLNGYYTVGIGKISHSPDGYIYKYLEPKSNRMELPQSWDEMLLDPGKWKTGWNAFFGYASGENRNTLKGEVKPSEAAAVNDNGYPDGLTADLTVKKLRELARRGQPFMLGVGFFKPHLPFNAPKKYWDLYDENSIALTPSPNIPEKVNKASLQESGEFNGYKKGDERASLEKPVSDAYARKLRHAYYAGVSYTDSQIGKVLSALKNLQLDKNTIIVLWGDHGWHLGDDRVWGKHTLSEWALRSPLIIHRPEQNGGNRNSNIVSSVDVYPTLMELCRIKMPYPADGKSLVNLLANPNNSTWHKPAYSYYRKGISMRTERYRFTRYFREEKPVAELYDHEKDRYENSNIAAENPDVVKQLMPLWQKGNTGLYANTTHDKNQE